MALATTRLLDPPQEDPAADLMWWALPDGAPYDYIDRYFGRGCADPAGRVAISVTPGKWLLGVASKHGFATHTIEADIYQSKPIELQLQAFAKMELLAVGEDGAPIPGVSVRTPNHRTRLAQHPLTRVENALTESMAHGLISHARSDADGRVTLQSPANAKGRWGLKLHDSASGRQSTQFLLEPVAKPARIVLR